MINIKLSRKQVYDFNRAANLLRALGHPARLKILFLLEDKEANVDTIKRHIRLSQAQTSHHLKTLHELGILRRRPQGTSNYYTIRNGVERKLLPGLRKFKALWKPEIYQSPS
ncbi:MAG: metalloregulator ArsR/SmtB family transcription factor [Candidatus Neomarinimicrobiota bacterium]